MSRNWSKRAEREAQVLLAMVVWHAEDTKGRLGSPSKQPGHLAMHAYGQHVCSLERQEAVPAQAIYFMSWRRDIIACEWKKLKSHVLCEANFYSLFQSEFGVFCL